MKKKRKLTKAQKELLREVKDPKVVEELKFREEFWSDPCWTGEEPKEHE